MPQSVSVPEKTLEHWSSQYVTYRYASFAALWWPASGQDVDVRWLPPSPGKAVQLELKTTTVAGAGLHDVLVDLGQLWEYRQRPLGRQPFYAFPWPDWHGDLTAVASAHGRSVTELAFSRSGANWWFADWMVLLTAAEVAAVLHIDLIAHGSRRRGIKKRLVRFDLSKSMATPKVTWGSGPTGSPPVVRWRQFWAMLEQCGRAGWPQLIRLPARVTPPQDLYSRTQVVEMLRQAAVILAEHQWNEDELLVTLEPDEEGNYQIAPASVDDLGGSPGDEADEVGNHRQFVFLEARTLLRAR
jgi:hypothetical protein